ncbi:MAG TPA: hypothetical protein VGO63_00010 [Candidatus Paceibacterota bacterium]|jgi:hypothetical protein|nr:hypothetical protein [Candidatus Paceibacterota bacterium]
MKTIGIQVKRYANEVNIINNNDIEKRLLKILLWSFALLSVFYVIFLGNIIFNIVERRTLEADARTLGNEVMEMEAHYLAMSSKIDLAYSHAAGFSDAKATFATRQPLTALGFASKTNGNEI